MFFWFLYYNEFKLTGSSVCIAFAQDVQVPGLISILANYNHMKSTVLSF